MPSGPKKRRAQKKKDEAAAREITENEATLTASSKEHSPVMQSESSDGVTAVFDEPTVVLPKSVVLLKNMLASEVLDTKRKDTEECFKENELTTEIFSGAQSLKVAEVAEPLEVSPADKTNEIGESSAFAALCVIELDSEDEDGCSMMSPNACDSEANETEGSIEIIMPTEIYSSVLVSKPHVTSPANGNDDVATDAIELSQDVDGGSNLDSDETAFSVITGDAALTTELYVEQLTYFPTLYDHNQDAVDCTNAESAVFTDVHQETAALDKVNAPEKIEEAVQVDEVDAPEKTEEAIQVDDVEAPEKSEEAVQADEVEVAVKNQEAAISEGVIEKEKNSVDVVAKPAVDIINKTHDAVSTEPMTPEVEKQLQEIKEMVEDVLNRLITLLQSN